MNTRWLEPDREVLTTFVKALFKYAAPEGYVSLRAFRDDASNKVFRITPTRLTGGLDFLIDAAEDDARRAANDPNKIVFCPPVATFTNNNHAREEDIAEGLVLSVECDEQPQAARAKLEALLGPATVVVASGGEWKNGSAPEPKLHIHYRQRKPARGGDELEQLKLSRKLAAMIAGGDPSNVPTVHPIRWPGSWHRKGEPRLCRIVAVNPDCEIDLVASLKTLIAAVDPDCEIGGTKEDLKKAALAAINKKASKKSSPLFEAGVAGKSEIQSLNDEAMKNLDRWVLEIFPKARPYHGGYRVSSADLGRKNEEDLSLVPEGIKDFGVHDLDDPLQGKRGPVDVVMEWLLKVPIEKIADDKINHRRTPEFDEAVAWLREKLGHANERPTKLITSSAEFVADFTPPDYLIDGLLQRRFLYSFTGPTGSGKTCVVLRITAHVALGVPLANMEVEKGRVLFFAGENPVDVQMRWIKLCEEIQRDPAAMDVFFLAGALPIDNEEIRKQIDAEAAEHGPFCLLIVDTSAAYFQGDDENSNVQLGNHARMLRTFVDLPGGPTVIVTCHPTKNPDTSNLVPRGGGAFLNEVDGNLACLKEPDTMMVEVTTHGKFRGPEFMPFSFELIRGTSDKLVDSKGRSISTVIAKPLNKEEQAAIEIHGRDRQDELLRAMLAHPGLSLAQLAGHLTPTFSDIAPNKNTVHRMMKALAKDKLVRKQRGRYVLTKTGEKEANATIDRTEGQTKGWRNPTAGEVRAALKREAKVQEKKNAAVTAEVAGKPPKESRSHGTVGK